ncbi:MAG: lasso peptide biosynthesis PqqD family chaperone [Lachnospiraceae bacterium]|nr:lasso peptide biosynthesis PqqD family chaperone [Lachnospiraceae bacterium]
MSEKKYKRRPDVISADMDGEVVMMDIMSGKYYNLGTTGGAIWGLLETPKTIDELVDELTSKYDVDRETCAGQVGAFLESGVGKGLFSVET